MKLVVAGRGQGKTERLLRLAAECDGRVWWLACTEPEADRIGREFKKRGMDHAVTINSSGKRYGTMFRDGHWYGGERDFLFIDNYELLPFPYLFYSAYAVSINAPEGTDLISLEEKGERFKQEWRVNYTTDTGESVDEMVKGGTRYQWEEKELP